MSTDSKTYRIVLDDKQFIGTAEDVARWYCQQRGVKLYVEGDGSSEVKALYAYFSEVNKQDKIAQFKEGTPDLETGYRLFFTEYLLVPDELDCDITEITNLPSTNELTGELIKYMDRLHPERDACLEAAGRIACESMRAYEGLLEDSEHYIRIVISLMGYAYQKLLELRCEEWD